MTPDGDGGAAGGAPAAGGGLAATPPGAHDPPSILSDGAGGQSAASPAPSPGLQNGYVLADGTFAADWTNRLPEELGEARVGFGKYKSVAELAKGLHNANELIGRRGVTVPGENSTPAEIAAYRKALGIPETPEGYSAQVKPEKLPEGFTWDDGSLKPYLEAAHRHNIPPQALKELIELNMKQREGELAVMTNDVIKRQEEGRQVLQQMWRDKYGDNIKLAQRAAHSVGVDPSSFGFGDPQVVMAFVRLAGKMGEDQLVGSGGMMPTTQADLLAKAKDVQTNKANPLYQRYQDGDPDTVAMVRNWIRQGTPQ